jgi:hypothetical protein
MLRAAGVERLKLRRPVRVKSNSNGGGIPGGVALRYAQAMTRILTIVLVLLAGGFAAGCSKCDDFWGPRACRSDTVR